MKAAIINHKTIIVWQKMSNTESDRLLSALQLLIKEYTKISNEMSWSDEFPIPISLSSPGKYLTIVQKHGSVLLSTTKILNGYSSSPLLNGDELYDSIEYIEGFQNEFDRRVKVYQRTPDVIWENIQYNKDVSLFLLSPRPNPEDFIEKLKQNNPPEMYKKFLDDVGIALKSPDTQIIDIENNQIQID